jgi:hypothetical protein
MLITVLVFLFWGDQVWQGVEVFKTTCVHDDESTFYTEGKCGSKFIDGKGRG